MKKMQSYYATLHNKTMKAKQQEYDRSIKKSESTGFDQMINKTYVINLDKDAHRMINVARQLDEHDIEYERFPGIDGRQINIRDLVKQNVLKRQGMQTAINKPGSLGCYLSHLQLWIKIRDSLPNGGAALIFEDDIHLTRSFKADLVNYMTNMPINYDVVYLGYGMVYGNLVSEYAYKPIQGNHVGYNSGMYGYVVNQATIDNLINVCFPIVHPVKDPVIRSNFNKLNAFYITKKIVLHSGEFESSRNQGNKK